MSMVHHGAIDMYLLAIKSFMYYFCMGSVHVLNDGSLTKDDIKLLKYHIPNIIIEHIDNVDTGDSPKGGCWERLYYLIELSKKAYVIQLDSDTLTRAPLFDIYNAIENQQGFTIGSQVWNKPVDINYLENITQNWVKQWEHIHVQPAAERIFSQIDFFQSNNKYIRGCAAFAGFPKQQITHKMLSDFSKQVSDILGMEKWSEWGSEQVASNCMVTRTNGAFVLPWPEYQNYRNPMTDTYMVSNAVFLHFIGSVRFTDRTYEKYSKELIRLLETS